MSVYPSAATNPTLMDFLQALGPDNGIAGLGELLNQTNQILEDMTYIEANQITGHRFAIRTGLPTPTWRRYYQGVQPTKSNRAQVQASIGMVQDYAEVDKDLADLNGNAASFRLNEDRAHIEGMSQEVATKLIYGSEATDPNTITGFMPHYNDLSAPSGEMVLDAEGTGDDNASILLVGWAPHTVYGIYPKGSQAGLQMEDKGPVTATAKTADNSADGYYEAYRTHYKWDLGLVIQDYRYVVRIANIDRSLLGADPTVSGYTGANLANLMFEAMEMVPTLEGVRWAWYMDRTILTKLRQQLPNALKGSTLSIEMVGGKRVTSFQEIPIRRVDKMKVDEARVV